MTQHEIYPMPAFPKLAVQDLATSTRWYQEVAGFHLIFEIPDSQGKPLLSHLRWKQYADLLLVLETSNSSSPKGVGVSLTFMLPSDGIDSVSALAAGAQAKGANVLSGPALQPWGTNEVAIADPDGYRLVFGERAIEQSFDAALKAIARGS